MARRGREARDLPCMTARFVSGGDQDIDIGRLVILHVARMPYQRTDLQSETMRAFDLVRRWHAEGTDDHPCLRMLVYNLEPRFGLCKMKGKSYVDGQLVVEGDFQFAMVKAA